MERCCRNCFYFRSEVEDLSSDGTTWAHHCDLHNLHNGEVSHPDDQFCGDENWISSKIKTRINNLKKLGI